MNGDEISYGIQILYHNTCTWFMQQRPRLSTGKIPKKTLEYSDILS